MREVEFTTRFKKEYNRVKKNPNNNYLDFILREVVRTLQNNETLSPNFQPHKLKGKFKQFEECHLKPDLLLVYLKIDNKLKLIRIGSHSELFK